jgi:Mrp family chromosome partitioning ATPase
VSGESRKTVWQKPIVSIGELDVGPYLATLLEKIGSASNGRGKVAVVTSVETGGGASTVARSLNQATLNSGKISVLIQVQPDSAGSRLADSSAEQITKTGYQASRTSLRSVSLLLSSNRNVDARPGDDIRSDFDLIVIDVPPLRQQPEVASLAAQADVVILVARDGAADRSAIESAGDLLSKSGPAGLGLVVNQVGPPRIIQAQGAISGLAS